MLVDALHRLEDAEHRAKDEGERTRERLSAALRATGVVPDQNSDLEALIEATETALSAEAQFAALRQKAEERRAEVSRAEANSEPKRSRELASSLARTCAGTWLGEAKGEPALGASSNPEALGIALDAKPWPSSKTIAKMERDKLWFADEVSAAAARLI
jgi:hypothetical protein